ncbi:MAG: response regulator [Candidatus Dojkabacteria bacterium]
MDEKKNPTLTNQQQSAPQDPNQQQQEVTQAQPQPAEGEAQIQNVTQQQADPVTQQQADPVTQQQADSATQQQADSVTQQQADSATQQQAEVVPQEPQPQTAPAQPVAQQQDAVTERQFPIDPKDAQILLAEDEEDARTIYQDVLDDEFNISTSKNGRDTLAKLAEKPFDLILLDIIMPDMDGISVLTELKKYPAKYGNPIVVMLTNIGGDLAIEKALAIGANGYLLKSEAEPTELIKAIKKYLQGQEHVKLEKYLTDE